MARLLIVDDQEDAAESLALVADLLGHEAKAVTRPQVAMEAIRFFMPDLVLCDLNMPDISGFEIARQVRAEPDLAHLFLVACTGFDIPPFRDRAEAAGFDEVVPKPMTAENLADLLRAAEARREARSRTTSG